MKSLMFILAFGLATSEKLDRTYLPPPGSKFAGGDSGNLQVPLEFPKETYTTIAPFKPGENEDEPISFGDTRLVPGSQRTGPKSSRPSTNIVPATLSTRPPSTYFQNRVPMTTTSYAFTQTTTYAPTEGFETTSSPILPLDKSVGDQTDFSNQPFNQGPIYSPQPGQTPPGFVQPGNQILQKPRFFLPVGSNISEGKSSFPGQSVDGSPAYTPGQNVNQHQPDVKETTASPISGGSLQAGLVTPSPFDQGYTQRLGVQPLRQFNQQGFTPLPTHVPVYQTNYPSQFKDKVSNVQGTQQPSVSSIFGPEQSTSQYIDKYENFQSNIPTFTVPHQILPSQSRLLQQSQMRFSGDLNSISGPLGPSKQGVERPQSLNYVPHGSTISGFIPSQQEIVPTQLSGQQGTYQTSTLGEGHNVPGIQQQRYGLPLSQGQFESQQLLRAQLPGVIGQQSLYQSNIVPEQATTHHQGGQPHITIQHGTMIPGQINFPQAGSHQPQILRQQGTTNPGQTLYQRPSQQTLTPGQQGSTASNEMNYQQTGSQQPHILAQQSPFTNRQGLTIPGQTKFPTQKTISNTEIANNLPLTPSGTQSTIIPGSNEFRQKQITGNLPSIESPGQTQGTDSRLLSQQRITPRPGQTNLVTGSPQNVYAPGSTAPPAINHLPSSSSTTLDSGAIYTTNLDRRPERPQAESDRNAVILNYENVLTPDGYAYRFDTSNGIHADENGTAIDGVKADGSYSYIGDDGKLYSVVYTADENGFRPRGDHLPTPPPVPEAIQEIIAQAAKDREAGIFHDGFYDEEKYGHHKYQKPENRPKSQGNIVNGVDTHNHFNRRLSAKRPQHQLIGQRPDERRPYASGQDSPSRYSDIPSRKGKPVSSNDKPNVAIHYNDEESPEQIEDDTNKSDLVNYNEGSISPSKITENRYLPNYERKDLAEHVNSKQQNDNRIRQGAKRPIFKENSYDFKQSFANGVRPQKPMNGPSKSFEMKYQINDDYSDDQDNYEPKSLNQKDQRTMNGPNEKKSSISRKTFGYKQKASSDLQDDNLKNSKLPTGSKFDQNARPSYNQHNENNEQYGETGYQYTQPKNKFDLGTSRFPSRFSDKTTPGNKHAASDKKTTVQPFIISNVNRDEDGSNEDVSEENTHLRKSTKAPEKPFSATAETTDKDFLEYYQESEPEQYTDEENMTSKKFFSGKAGLTRQPGYSSLQETRKPAYNDEYTNGNDQVLSEGSKRPDQKVDDRYSSDSGEQRIRGRLGQNYSQLTKGTSKIPTYSYVSSTTPLPNRKQYRPGTNQPSQQEEQSQYPTSYEPSDTSSINDEYLYTEDSVKPEFSTLKPNSKRPVTPGPNQPGSYFDKTMTPISPTIRPGSLNKPSFSTAVTQAGIGSSRKPGVFDKSKPGSVSFYPETDTSEENNYSELGSFSQQSQPSRLQKHGETRLQNHPSTSYGPNYTISDISQPGSVTVDTFGRPVQSVSDRGTTIPDYSTSPGQENFESRTRPDQPAATFKPTEPRFGEPSQGNAGLKPSEFGPSSLTNKGYLSPYGPETVVGEDFRGPKQPQKFDPETGYYY